MAKRVIICEFKHETNTFSPISTDLERYKQRCLLYGADIISSLTGTHASIGGYIDAANKAKVELIPTVAADATPAGKVTNEAYEHIVKTLLEGIENAINTPGGIDGIALSLHGAMVVEGFDDGEGELLRRVRKLVGPDIPIVGTLDLHANITLEMVEYADCLFGYDTNPHVDLYERAQEAFSALQDIWSGDLIPEMKMYKTELLAPTINMRTEEGPMVELFKLAKGYEKMAEVRNVSVFGGFPFADVKFAGLSIVVLTNNKSELAMEICESIAIRHGKFGTSF